LLLIKMNSHLIPRYAAGVIAVWLMGSAPNGERILSATAQSSDLSLSRTSGRCVNCDLPLRLGRIQFLSAKIGWGCGYYLPKNGNGTGASTILRTVDGGRSWRQVPFVHQRSAEEEPAFFFADSKHGWLAYFDSWKALGQLSQTTDGGQSWTHRESAPLSQLQFFDRFYGYSAGTELSGSFFRSTTNGGDTWVTTKLAISRVDLMSFVDRNQGVIAGTDDSSSSNTLAVVFTRDGGRRWIQAHLPKEMTEGRPRSLQWVNSTKAFLIVWRANGHGSELLETTDGGTTWAPHPDKSFQGARNFISTIVFTSADQGYLFYEDPVASRNFIAWSADGGRVWKTGNFPSTVSYCQVFERSVLCSSGMNLLKIGGD
jgi:photosystem II stability/assembly factor-like uncharacterized protein